MGKISVVQQREKENSEKALHKLLIKNVSVSRKDIEASYPYCDARLTRAEQDKIRKEMVRKFGLLDV